MKWLPRLLVTALLSAGVALALSFLPRLENGWNSPAFGTAKAQPVYETNIVDVMSKIQLHERIRRVEVTNAIVSVDLLASASSEKSEIVKDLYEIPKTLFSRSTNINQVLVRVMDGSKTGTGETLLLAVDAKRQKRSPGEPARDTLSAEDMERYLQSHFQMTYTPKWQERFM